MKQIKECIAEVKICDALFFNSFQHCFLNLYEIFKGILYPVLETKRKDERIWI